jgi:hypothetical protein
MPFLGFGPFKVACITMEACAGDSLLMQTLGFVLTSATRWLLPECKDLHTPSRLAKAMLDPKLRLLTFPAAATAPRMQRET